MNTTNCNQAMSGMRRSRALLWALGAGAATLLVPNGAAAGDWSFHIDIGDHHRPLVRTVYAEPVYELRTRRVWVEPEYVERTVRVEVRAVVQTREVPVRDRWGNTIDYRLVREVVEPARTELRTERVLVREGYYRTITVRVLVTPVIRKVVRHRRAPRALSVGFGYRSDNAHGHYNRRHHGRVRQGGNRY